MVDGWKMLSTPSRNAMFSHSHDVSKSCHFEWWFTFSDDIRTSTWRFNVSRSLGWFLSVHVVCTMLPDPQAEFKLCNKVSASIVQQTNETKKKVTGKTKRAKLRYSLQDSLHTIEFREKSVKTFSFFFCERTKTIVKSWTKQNKIKQNSRR